MAKDLLKQQQKEEAEQKRVRALYTYEEEYYNKGQTVCGCDEAGRGALCGPLVASAVILPPYQFIKGLNDSKKVTAKRRSEIFDEILECAVAYSIQIVEPKIIDQKNIFRANMDAIRDAINELFPTVQVAFIDGSEKPGGIKVPSRTIVHGDGASANIAAASILAKVTRDRIMINYDKEYPMYKWVHNMGYGTKEHREAIYQYGPCPIHRWSFSPVNQFAQIAATEE